MTQLLGPNTPVNWLQALAIISERTFRLVENYRIPGNDGPHPHIRLRQAKPYVILPTGSLAQHRVALQHALPRKNRFKYAAMRAMETAFEEEVENGSNIPPLLSKICEWRNPE